MKKTLLFLLAISISLTAFAQNKTVTGVVTDAKDKSTLPGVSVTLKEAPNIGTQTDATGHYNLSVPANATTLIINYIGFGTVQVPITGNVVNASIRENAQQLSEVVVVGYGTQTRQTVTGSIAGVTAKDIQETPVTTVEQALQGKIAGVAVSANNGKLGQGMQIKVRGTSSISASSQPLYVLDGVIITATSQSGTSAATNPLADINFDDIASIDVLKDASAAAIYGARASNGVVIITTKKGKAGTPSINFTAQFGDSQPSRHRTFLNASQYVQMEQRAGLGAANQDYLAGYFSTLQSAQAYYSNFVNNRLTRYAAGSTNWQTSAVNTDWEKLAFQKAPQSQYDLNLSGGSDKTTYYIGGQYLDQKGMLIGNAFKRFSGRLNLDSKLYSNLSVGMNMSFARTINNRVSNDDAFSTPLQIVALSPITPEIDPRSGLISGTLPNGVSNTSALGSTLASTYPVYYNPLISQNNAYFNTNVYRLLGNVYGDLKIAKGFSFRTELGVDQLNQNEDSYDNSLTFRNSGTANGAGSNGYTQVLNYTTNNFFTYKNTFNLKHTVDFTGGMSYQFSQTNFNLATGTQFPSDAYKTISSAATTTGSSGSTSYSFVGYFLRGNYAYQNKYLASASIRDDASSRFGVGNRYGVFPSGSLGYVMSEEDFIKNIHAISNLKVRVSYGLTGNADISNFAALGLFTGTASYNGVAGQRVAQIANPNLKWESTRQVDAGLDIGFFNSRLTGSFDYYRKNTHDLLLNVNVPGTSGFSTQFQNAGKLYNQGIELGLSSQNLVGKFKWSTSVNFAYNKNVVTDVGGQIIGTNDLNRVIEGQPIGVFYGREYAGVDPANGDALYYLNTTNADGTRNRTKTNDYNSAQNVILGNPTPKLNYGFTNNFSYYGFDLAVTFQGVYGNKVYNSGGQYMSANASNGFDNQTIDQENYWNKPGDITNVPEPRLFYGNGIAASSRYLYDASYLRCKVVSFGYTLPKSLLSKINVKRARVFMNAYNLFVITKYKGWDPEVNADYQASPINLGVDFYSAPQPRTITFGLNIGL
ncbi:MAG: SusC/RagA family TonB-linked outer membrane protein [Janthinobacterium lividum]